MFLFLDLCFVFINFNIFLLFILIIKFGNSWSLIFLIIFFIISIFFFIFWGINFLMLYLIIFFIIFKDIWMMFKVVSFFIGLLWVYWMFEIRNLSIFFGFFDKSIFWIYENRSCRFDKKCFFFFFILLMLNFLNVNLSG